jgi:hypothetical protein
MGCSSGWFYARHSLVALKLWIKHALLKGRPWTSWADLVANHMESPGTKAYTIAEVQQVWSGFSSCETQQIVTVYDRSWFPRWMHRLFPAHWGWFIVVRARK